MRNLTLYRLALYLGAFYLSLLPSFGQESIAPKDLSTHDYTVKHIITLTVDSSINPATLSYLQTHIQATNPAQGELVSIQLNTPGGLVSTTKEIITLIGESEVPIIIWITPQGASATSAGAIIASSAHLLFMSEGTNIGAATPVALGKDIEKSDGREKAINDLVALVTSLSQSRGRNQEAFEKMISESASFKAQESLQKKIVDGIVNRESELLDQIDGKLIRIKGKELKLKLGNKLSFEQKEMDPGQKILNIFSNPMTAYIFFILGAALLYLEFQAPGGFIAGSLGAVFLVLAGIGFQVLPLNFGALGLIILSFILFILEIYITSYGILALAGTAALVFGSLFLYRTENAYVDMQLPLILSVVGAVLLYVFVVGYVLFSGRKKKLVKFFDLSGQTSRILRQTRQSDQLFHYQVKIGAETWNAVSEKEYAPGDLVKIIEQDNDKMLLILES